MSAYAEDVRVISGEPMPAPAPADASVGQDAPSPAESDRSDCPYCGDTGRGQVRRYRFCGHGTP